MFIDLDGFKRQNDAYGHQAAALHGPELLRRGYSVDQVVHDYGDVCQSVTALAVEQKIEITANEFRILNRCFDDDADAVTSFGSARQISIDAKAATLHQRLAIFTDEQQRLIDIAIQAFSALKNGNMGLTGATGALVTHTLEVLHSLGERSLPESRTVPSGDVVVSG